ncbi:MAG: non-canonical purine NTP pyrophosphatase, partial [Treponema sp.]|nr:non-canonical purine NTP pyrophosphatase [Treponema sp.]
NALIKAKALYRILREPVIADDSGLCVDALDGRPGVYSSRYGAAEGKALSAEDRNALLLHELEDTPQRSARFVCALVALFSPDRFYAVQETLEGEILREARGAGGFGYDPLLYIPGLGRSAAELEEAEKNRVSHRGKAGRRLAALLNLPEPTHGQG